MNKYKKNTLKMLQFLYTTSNPILENNIESRNKYQENLYTFLNMFSWQKKKKKKKKKKLRNTMTSIQLKPPKTLRNRMKNLLESRSLLTSSKTRVFPTSSSIPRTPPSTRLLRSPPPLRFTLTVTFTFLHLGLLLEFPLCFSITAFTHRNTHPMETSLRPLVKESLPWLKNQPFWVHL